MNHKLMKGLALFFCTILFTACQTSKFKDCKSLAINSAEKTVPFYTAKKISDKNIGGYLSSDASIAYADGSCEYSQKVKVRDNSALKDNEVWLDQKDINCKK